MLTAYRTLYGFGEDVLIEKKSKFIAYALPIVSEAEAEEFLAKVKKEHYKATHHVSAWVLGENDDIMRFSDDGEPSGTAGRPVLEVIRRENLKNCMVVVVRYFGGVLLGANGLVRAYSQSAKLGVNAAKIVTKKLFHHMVIELDYSLLGKVQYYLAENPYIVRYTDYTDRIKTGVDIPFGEKERFHEHLTEISGGQIRVTHEKDLYLTELDGRIVD